MGLMQRFDHITFTWVEKFVYYGTIFCGGMILFIFNRVSQMS